MQSPLEQQNNNLEITNSYNTDIVIPSYESQGIPSSEPKGYEELLDDYQAALAGKARLIQAYNSLGITLFQQNKFAESIEHFRKILDFSEDLPKAEHAKVYFNIGMGLRR
ncbi:MAG TPA: tetratricopeptide repeat protein, partial [Crinalium sp.]